MRKFFNEHRLKMILSSLLILVPTVVGVILWDKLPASMNIHWDVNGNADGTGAKAMAVFVLPLILLALHWVAMVVTAIDPGNKNQNRKAFGLIFWIIPVLSLFISGIIYSSAFGKEMGMFTFVPIFISALFIVMGNYMPKVKQNSTYGIKVKWTLQNEENWTMTHRFAGKLWVAAGILMLISLLLPMEVFVYVLLADVLVVTFCSTFYSYFYYRKQLKRGDYVIDNTSYSKFHKKGGIVGVIVGIILAILIVIILFTGDITYVVSENSFTVKADYYINISVDIDEIDSIELREKDSVGVRANGFSSPRLLLGTFKNKEFGYYTRYTYTNKDVCIVIKKGDNVLVIGGKDAAATEKIYNEIISKR